MIAVDDDLAFIMSIKVMKIAEKHIAKSMNNFVADSLRRFRELQKQQCRSFFISWRHLFFLTPVFMQSRLLGELIFKSIIMMSR